MSKLIVEVCKIEKIENLENAQKLQMATIKGWQCLVGKDQHHEGELVLYIPPDSVVPEELMEALQLTYLKESKGRVKTIRLRGYISQGLVVKHDEVEQAGRVGLNWTEGSDLAEKLGIKKYEVPQKAIAGPRKEYIRDYWAKYLAKEITLRRFVAKSVGIIKDRLRKPKLTNENFKVYTDLQNVKHYPNIFEPGEEVVVTEKIHGTNFRAGNLPVKPTFLNKLLRKSGYEFCYGSHRVQKTALSGKGFYGEDVYGQIAAKYGLRDILPNGYTIYGEIYGPKIQNMTYGVEEIQVAFFDLQIEGKYVDYQIFKDFCELANLPMAPVLFKGRLDEGTLKLCTDGKTIIGNGCHIREGAVIKPVIETYDPRAGRKILKSISAEYLLTKDEDNAEFTH